VRGKAGMGLKRLDRLAAVLVVEPDIQQEK
jgi:hypothetical protein